MLGENNPHRLSRTELDSALSRVKSLLGVPCPECSDSDIPDEVIAGNLHTQLLLHPEHVSAIAATIGIDKSTLISSVLNIEIFTSEGDYR